MSSENQLSSQKPLVGSRLSSELYQSFVNYLQNESKRMPSKNLLFTEMTQTMNLRAKKTSNAIRKKFRNWTKRMALSNGLLIHKPTEKTIIPQKKFYDTIKEIHESSPLHLNVTQTVRQIKTRFTWSSKNFGMNLTDVLMVLSDCQHKKCQKSVHIIKNRLKTESFKQKPHSFLEDCHSSGTNADQNEDKSRHFSVDKQTKECVDCEPFNDRNKLYNELVFKIRFMRLNINLLKIHKFRRTQSLRESIQKCEELIDKIRASLQ